MSGYPTNRDFSSSNARGLLSWLGMSEVEGLDSFYRLNDKLCIEVSGTGRRYFASLVHDIRSFRCGTSAEMPKQFEIWCV